MFNDGKRLWFMIIVALSTLLGCGNSPDRSEGDSARIGTLSAALVATGSDGASYRFPAGTLLDVFSDSFTAVLPLNTDEDVASARLPVGVFQVAPLGATQLERTSNGTTTLVDATLLNVQPIALEIFENQVTSLELRFQVTDVSSVTFSVGSLRVALGVEVEHREFGRQVLTDATANVQQVTFSASATSAARQLLAVDVGTAAPLHLVFEPTSPWALEVTNTACVRGQLTSAQSSPQSLLSARFAEVVGAEGSYCITDYGSQDLAFLNVLATTTPVDQRSALPGADNLFFLVLDGTIDDVFDGVTLRQQELEQPHAFSGGHFTHRIVASRANEIIADLFASLDGDFELKP
ncbi:MAG TPA: hypothetical protein VFK05_02720 [Polyangiaceae bacterium]|nr:hypothetical protein [Polyangiaceae bacterium]